MAIRHILDLGFIILFGMFQNMEIVLDIYGRNNNLSLEDCIYLETCRDQGWKLITFDKKLKEEFEKGYF